PLFVAPAAQQVYRLASSHGLARKGFTSVYTFLQPSPRTAPVEPAWGGFAACSSHPALPASPSSWGSGGWSWGSSPPFAEIVRQVVVRQVPKAIGRQITIEDIDLNLFTGKLAIKKLRLSERTGSQAFVEFERLEARMALLSLVHKDIHLRDFRLVAPVVRVVRGPDGKLNFDDLMPAVQERPLAREPTKWDFRLDHAAIEGGRVIVDDRAVTPAADWSIQDLALETSGVTTRPNAPPGWLKGSLRMGAAALQIKWDSFEQAPVRVAGTVKLAGFNLTRVRPYLPPTLASAFASGTLGIDLKVAYTRTEQGLQSARASGEAAVENAALVAPGTTDTLVGLARLKVGLKQFDLESRH